MPRETSKETYHQIKASGLLGKMQLAVYELLYLSGEPLTGAEVNARMGSYSGHKRLSELKRMGVVEEDGTRACGVTGRNSLTWVTTNSLPREPEEKPKPIMVLEVYGDGKAVIRGGETYDGGEINQLMGVRKSDQTFVYNGRKALQIKLWKGMSSFPENPEDINT